MSVQFGADADAQFSTIDRIGGCIGFDMFDIESEPGAMHVRLLTRCGGFYWTSFQSQQPYPIYRYNASEGAYVIDNSFLDPHKRVHNKDCGRYYRLEESDLLSLRLGYNSYWVTVGGKSLRMSRGTRSCDRQE
ncbi:hypothetical protein FOZ60_010386 [Perkinsus olseni]|uniref:Uncharacterized protein n=1 Tax=Perkinsus olseni TaxID=32597 RepID=A0A7J6N818_PEROL|nr:hypothetical protein FOZ60_014154 [Perkinsus olseni]KAF4682591.1 hypothetical protein FOZ60_010386 [Perkinsus olseni]